MLPPFLRGSGLRSGRQGGGDDELVPHLDLLTSPRIEFIYLLDRHIILACYAVDGLFTLHLVLTYTSISLRTSSDIDQKKGHREE